ncbi:MAG: hypothetical protein Q4A89_06290 [Tannerella sp.]|nr:hypothetical protein [Tannerella sp.]
MYTYYEPSSRSGVFGMNIADEHLPEGVKLRYSDVLPLYRFQIDTVIRYRYMTHNERQEEEVSHLYRVSHDYFLIPDYERFYKYIWYAEYESVYHYYDKQDSIEHSGNDPYCDEDELLAPTSDLGMCYFPMERLKLNYYQHGRLVKRFLGFCTFDWLLKPEYFQEVDTALLALPTKHFMREFLRTEQLDCLDGKTFPLPQKQPHAPPETVIP